MKKLTFLAIVVLGLSACNSQQHISDKRFSKIMKKETDKYVRTQLNKGRAIYNRWKDSDVMGHIIGADSLVALREESIRGMDSIAARHDSMIRKRYIHENL